MVPPGTRRGSRRIDVGLAIDPAQLLTDITRAQQGYAVNTDERVVFDRLLSAILHAADSEYGFIGRILEGEQGPYLKTLAITNIAWDEATNALYAQAQAAGLEFRNLDTLFGKVVQTRELLIANDAPHHPSASGIPKGHPPLRAFAGIPVYLGDRCIGMVGVANRPGGYCFDLIEALEPLLATVAQIMQGFEDRRQRDRLEERLSAVVALAPDAILTVDAQGRVLEANAGAERLLGTGLPGQGLANLLGLEALPSPNQPVGCTTQTEEPRQVELSVGDVVRGEPPFSVVIVRDVTEREEIREALADSESRWQHAISASTDGVWDWDLLTNYVYFSPRWLEMLGYGPTELPHHVSTFFELLNPEDAPRVDAEVKKHIAGETERYTVEFRLRHKDGSWRWILARGRILKFTQDGRPWRFTGTHVDIHQQRLQAEQLRKAKDLAESATRAKAAFLANMSHEIRTPMNAIVSTAHLLEGSRLDDEQSELVQLIRNASGNLLGIVSDVLDLSKIESGRLQLESVAFSLQELACVLERTHGLAAGRKGLALSSYIDPRLPGKVAGDPTRLQQVLNNLLSNAVKFTGQGRISLRVEQTGMEADAIRVRFEVADTGIGIRPDEMEKVFQPFQQAEESTTRRFGGTGLGLSISRHLVELMGGSLQAESVENAGSRFYFELELSVHGGREVPAPGPEPDELFGRVLLVEDNPVNSKLTELLLQKLTKCEVDTAIDGQQALRMARERAYDLVLMDCQMPVMDGYQATAAIRALQGAPGRVPIVAQTANAFTEDRERCLAVGMDDFLTKPIDPAQLLLTLRRWIRTPATQAS